MPSQEYLEAKKKIEAAKLEAQNLAKRLFEKEAKNLIEELGIRSFSWTQYTPYFNDGDACVFRVNVWHGEGIYINGVNSYGESEDEDGDLIPDLPGRPNEDLYATDPEEYARQRLVFEEPFRKLGSFIEQWQEEDLLFMFGDHAIVTVTKDGIETDDYQHD